jgi:adenylylsulfate kinase
MQRRLKILIMGRRGAGKTALAKILASMLGAVHFSADELRESRYAHLELSEEDPVEQARRMGRYCDSVTATGRFAIADFVCPTPEAQQAFGTAFVIWVDRGREGHSAANRGFVAPHNFDVRVLPDGSPKLWAQHIRKRLENSQEAF